MTTSRNATTAELQAIAHDAQLARHARLADGPSICDAVAGEQGATEIVAMMRGGTGTPDDAWRLLHDHLTHQTIRDDAMTQAFVTTLAAMAKGGA